MYLHIDGQFLLIWEKEEIMLVVSFKVIAYIGTLITTMYIYAKNTF